MKLVYPVAWGEYEDYGTVALCATPELADEFVRLANERNKNWRVYLDAHPFQIVESSEDIQNAWPFSDELPEWPTKEPA